MRNRLLAVSVAAVLVGVVGVPAQLVQIPGYNVSFPANAILSVADFGGGPALFVALANGLPGDGWGAVNGTVVRFSSQPFPNYYKMIELRLLGAAAYDPRPCAPGGRVGFHLIGDYSGGPGFGPSLDAFGCGFAYWPLTGAPRYYHLPYTGMDSDFGFDYANVQAMSVYSTSPCGGFSNPGPRVLAFDVRLK